MTSHSTQRVGFGQVGSEWVAILEHKLVRFLVDTRREWVPKFVRDEG